MSLLTVSKIQKETSSTNIDVPSTGQFIDLASAAQGDVLYYDGTSYVRLGAGTSGQQLQTQGASANPIWAGAAGAALSEFDQWYGANDFTGTAAPLTAGLARVDFGPFEKIGTGMTVSSGVWTFPSTGKWWIRFSSKVRNNSSQNGFSIGIDSTVNNGTDWLLIASASGQCGVLTNGSSSATIDYGPIDITDVSNYKVRFDCNNTDANNTFLGAGDLNETYMTFIKLGDT